jgi:hypothetical protein
LANFFSNLFKKKDAVKQQNRVIDISKPYEFFWLNGAIKWEKSGTPDGVLKALKECPVVSTIINNEVEAFGNGLTQIVNPESGKAVRGAYAEIESIIKKPNTLQTQAQFEAQVVGYTRAYGYCPVIFKGPIGFPPTEMWVLPPQFCDIVIDDRKNPYNVRKNSDWIDRFTFKYGQFDTVINPDKVYFFTANTLPTDNFYLPESPLGPLSKPISILISYYNAENEMMTHRGPRGILANTAAGELDREPMSTEARDEIQRDFKNAYGFQPDQSQIIITDAALQWQSMSFNATELGLNETYKRAVFDIATGLGYPKDLLQLEGSTFNNQNTAWKSLYQDTVMPMAESYCMQLMELLKVDVSKVLIKKTYDHLEVMQESNEEKGKGIKAITEAAEMQFNLNAITFNQMLEMIGQKPITDGNRYKYQMSEIYENTNQTGSGEGDTPEES